ncbi:PLP-dependent aminotransferase family protein [Dyella sp. LX-66]|uniref:MocR-like pyridoxine biosynthesis transcription factor PdxR n=1 Tax=unclassified Dyella TaxID=2634549 RepID=UPI001BE08CA8|nr:MULTISPECIES: PLP-dependent aminotransferase family protein [unclassified Dyella]MBT2118038.1 PLP-dependent aminotransferase family protein [Dyella sp. LX-1]MBT2140945.1 PLP-dependent aminotransferase family protein [Dyella sp. LX-66]
MPRASTSFLPPIALENGSGVPIYQQLSEWFRRAIADGQLRPGQRVPSTRSLATELRVSRLPVLSAYEQLLAEGYLQSFVGAGTCVARSIPTAALKPARPRLSVVPVARQQANRRVAQRVAAMRTPEQTWLDSQGAFRVGLPALEHFPTELWAKLLNRHARTPSTESLVYGDPRGCPLLREAIADYLGAVRAVRVEAAQVLITTGSQQGVQICAHALLDAGDRAWLEDPGYPGARQAFGTIGARIVPVPVDQEGLDVAEGIRRAPDARLAYISPSHQFPLGMTMSAARRMQLLRWAARSGAWIVEDDYDSEYRFGGRPVASLQGLDTEERVIYVGTFSKVMFPALRLGYLVVPKDLVDTFAACRDALDTCTATLPQLAMNDFIREGHFARHIRRMRVLYAERRAALVASIRTHLPQQLEVIGAEAGMQLVALLQPGVDDVALSRRAALVGVSARPLSLCYAEPPARGGLIMGYGGADARALDEAVRRLTSCL